MMVDDTISRFDFMWLLFFIFDAILPVFEAELSNVILTENIAA